MFTIVFFFVGLSFGGFSAGLIGGFIGYLIDQWRASRRMRRFAEQQSERQYYTSEGQFEDEILVLISYVATADKNRLRQSELDYCKQFFQQNFPHANLSEMLLKFKGYLDAPNLDSLCQVACENIRKFATVHEKIAIIQALFGFVKSDGRANTLELSAVQRISDNCGLNRSTFEALKSLYFNFSYSGYSYDYGSRSAGEDNYGGGRRFETSSGPSLDECYRILEVSSDVSDDELKKAYRVAAMKHHPDKVSHLGEDVRKQAEEKFAKVNEAYEKIKASRGMK